MAVLTADFRSLDTSEALAQQVAGRFRKYESAVTAPKEAQNAVFEEAQHAVSEVLVNVALTLFAWDVVQRFVDQGAEGGQARNFVGKVCAAGRAWLENTRIAISWAARWHEHGGAPLSELDQLQHFERRLDAALAEAEQLLAFVNEPPPSLAPEVLERIEAAGGADDTSQYLSSQEFLARVRARLGA
jgi:hypothetical protein